MRFAKTRYYGKSIIHKKAFIDLSKGIYNSSEHAERLKINPFYIAETLEWLKNPYFHFTWNK